MEIIKFYCFFDITEQIVVIPAVKAVRIDVHPAAGPEQGVPGNILRHLRFPGGRSAEVYS